MALINCPECGKEISSSAKVCPHCGCEVTVCPDCNSVFTQKPEVCPSCGHIFNQPIQQNNDEINFVKNKLKIINFSTKFLRLLDIVSFVLFLIAITQIKDFSDSNPEYTLNEFANANKTVHTLAIIACIIYAFSNIASPLSFFISPAYIILKIILIIKKIDVKQSCRDYLKTTDKPVLNDYRLLLFATFLQSNKPEKNLYFVRIILSTLLTVVATVCCGKFIINYVDSYFYCQFWETENNFLTTFSSYIPLIIGGVAVIGKIIIELLDKSNNKMKQWCTDNSLPYDFNRK